MRDLNAYAGFALRGHSPEKDCSIETSTDSTEFLFFDFDWTRLSESQRLHVFLLVNGSCMYVVPPTLKLRWVSYDTIEA
jgi:hypothetical protein